MINVRRIKTATSLVSIAFRKYRGAFAAMIVLGFLAGFSGSIGIGAIIPIFFVISGQVSSETNYITTIVNRVFAFLHLPLTLPYLLGFMVALFIFKAVINFLAKFVNQKLVSRYEEESRNDLYGKTLDMAWRSLINQKVGYLERLLFHEVTQTAFIISQVSGVILTLTSFLTYAFVAIHISVPITLITVAFGGILFFAFKPIFSKARNLAAETGMVHKTAAHHVAEHTIGAKLIKAMGVESSVKERGSALFSQLRTMNVRAEYYAQMIGSFIEPLGLVFVATVFLFSYRTPGFNLAAFAVVVYLIQKMFSFIQTFQGQLHALNTAVPYLRMVMDYRRKIVTAKEIDAGVEPFQFKASLRFETVGFSYGPTQEILHDVSFTITRGTVVGIIGPSGAGKTTIVDLLLRLLKPDVGALKIDGAPIEAIQIKAWRNRVCYVPQDAFLLNDTIENNIRFYGDAITAEDIEVAVKAANLSEVIANLPEGLQSNVGERGMKLSGGQRQRVALARALARKPDILILDEATSALDNQSETLIEQAILALKGRMTIVLISHRVSSMMQADHLIVIRDGTKTEEGAPQELLKNEHSYFSKLVATSNHEQ